MTAPAITSIVILFAGSALALVGGPRRRAASLVAIPASLLALLASWGTRPQGWWAPDRMGLVLATTALLIGLCACRYALRQFEAERRGAPILAASLAVVGGVVATDLARTLAALAISWVVTSICTVLLLRASGGPKQLAAARRAALWFGVADGALVAGVLVASSLPGGLALDAPLAGSVEIGGGAAALLLCAAAIAAVGRAGLSKGHSWVTATIAAPTSVSALLHAGVVNAGALLLLRVEVATGASWAFAAMLVLTCLAALLALAPRIHERVDLKGQLAASTIAQMAFMLLAVGLGWSLLALTHLVGHGLYKAGRFMAAGGATEARARLRRRSATGTQQALRWRIGGVVGILLVAWAAAQAIGADGFAAMAVFGPAAAVVWWVRTATPTRGPVLSWGFLATGLLLYGAMVAGAQAVLGSSLPAGVWRAPWWSLGAAVALVATVAIRRRRTSAPASVERLADRAPGQVEEVAA